MTKNVIADTGVIVAFLDKREQYHDWSKKQVENIEPPFSTCEAVIVEAMYLLQGVTKGRKQLLSMVEENFLRIDFSFSTEVAEIKLLMQKYEDVPMAFADACLVRMSEQIENSVVFTLDGDFWVYRKNGSQQIPLIIPDNR